MPNASAPNAPWVLVWESPQTIVMPGWVSPSSRADDVDDALVGRADAVERDAELARSSASSWLDLGGGHRVEDGQAARSVVGIEWSAVATVCARDGGRGGRAGAAR